jgi:glutathione synthase/RimK-type ligase-like ATP-grasp enzyme
MVRELRKELPKSNKVINWGNPHPAECETILNSGEGVRNASNKKKARKIMAQAGISVPPICDINNPIFPCVGRPSYHHQGKHFFVCNSIEEMSLAKNAGATYFSKLIDKEKEFRVHVAHRKVLVIIEKAIGDTVQANKAITGLSWSKAVSWGDYNPIMCKMAIDAVSALGLDFGGVDIMLGKDGIFYVLEINTAPTIITSPYTYSRYKKYFTWWLLGNGNPWKGNYNLGKSYAWKNGNFETSAN